MSRRPRGAILPTLVIAAVIVVAFAIFTNIWTERLWYNSFDFGSVFNKLLLTRVGLFIAFGLIMATLIAANAAIAFRMRPKFSGGPASALLQRSRDVMETRFAIIVGAVSVVVGLFAGGAAAAEVSTYLAWRNATPFGQNDAHFGLDIGFFVFSYPWWRFVISFAFTGFALSAIAAAVVHYLTGAIRFSGRRGATAAAQAHLSILVGLAVLTKGASYWFDRYGLETSNTPLLTGTNYPGAHAGVTAKLILGVIAVVCACLFFANAVIQRWVVPTIGL